MGLRVLAPFAENLNKKIRLSFHMGKNETSRRGFLGTVGATALGGMYALSNLGCEPGEDERIVSGHSESSRSAKLLEVGEGVFRPTAVGATIHWVPKGRVESQLLAGSSETDLRVVSKLTSENPVELVIDGFASAPRIHWQCQHRRSSQDEWVVSPVRSFQTQRTPGESFQVSLFADSHFAKASRNPAELGNISSCMSAVRHDNPDFCVFMGDEVGLLFGYLKRGAPGAESNVVAQQRWRTWREFASPLLADIPSYFVLGNHEGEAGFYQDMHQKGYAYLQRWGTIARKHYYLNPLPTTYTEGGENAGWRGHQWLNSIGGASDGNCSPLQNYFAWSWGDALFVVLDVHRYTKSGEDRPAKPEDWTLGQEQFQWLEEVLKASTAKWKFVIAHHVVGGSNWNANCKNPRPVYAYGRGGARYARVGEQAVVMDIMKRTQSQFFLYGHDHIFAHQEAEGVHYVCCGRPTSCPAEWATAPGFKEAYGDYRDRNPYAYIMDLGYTRLSVTPDRVTFEYVKTGRDPRGNENIQGEIGEVVHRFEVT